MEKMIAAFCLLQLLSFIHCTQGLYSDSAVGHMFSAREVYIPCDSSCNNGVCDYTCGTCVCHPFYTGEHCDRPMIIPCGKYYCFNEGTCEVDGSGREYCRCPQGFSGDYCLVNAGTCFCMNGGTCVTRANVTTCTCPNGFLGSRCEIQISGNEELCTECGGYFCLNGGTCQNNTCQCVEGFGGDFCQFNCADSSEGLQQCGRHYCYFGGNCLNNTCNCQPSTFGPYCEYISAPSSQLTLAVVGQLTSATLVWSAPSGYDAIARYGGVWYTVHVQNMATGREETLTSTATTVSHDGLVHSTEYCFRVRAEVSGGAGAYSERKCYTSPAADSEGSESVPVVSIAAPSAAVLVIVLLAAVIVVTICYIWRVKGCGSKRTVDLMELSSFEAKGVEFGLEGKRHSTIVDVTARSSKCYETENVYQEIADAVGEMYECMDGEVTANPLVKADKEGGNDGKSTAMPQTSGDNDVYEHMSEEGSVTANPLAKTDISNGRRGSELYL